MFDLNLEIIAIGVFYAAPILFAAMGGLLSDKSGICNIALEGTMQVAMVMNAVIAISTGSATLGLLGGFFSGAVYGLILWVLTQYYYFDNIITGVILNTFALGFCPYIYQISSVDGEKGIPLFDKNFFLALSVLLPFLLHWMFKNTKFGLHILAVGNSPENSRLAGVSPKYIRFITMMLCGVCCALGGATILSIGGAYADNATAARGYTALAIIIIGGWRPLYCALWCLSLGGLMVLDIIMQGSEFFGFHPSWLIWNAMPYMVMILALAILGNRMRPPTGVGKV